MNHPKAGWSKQPIEEQLQYPQEMWCVFPPLSLFSFVFWRDSAPARCVSTRAPFGELKKEPGELSVH